MNVAQHSSPEDLTLYALRSLTPEEAAAVKAHAATCQECRLELTRLNLDLANLALDVPAIPPPPGARQRFMARVENEASLPGFRESKTPVKSKLVAMPLAPRRPEVPAPATAPQMPDATGPSRNLPGTWGVPWAIATAFALLALGAGIDNYLLRDRLHNVTHMSQRLQIEASRANDVLAVLTAPGAQRVTLTAGKTLPQPTGRASYLRGKGQLIFTANNLAGLPQGKIYELWLIPASGKPIPAGTFSPDTQGAAMVVFPKLPAGVEAKAFGVTVEPTGGSSAPTTAILLQGS